MSSPSPQRPVRPHHQPLLHRPAHAPRVPFALRIAQAIDRARRIAPLHSTAELAELVRTAIPAATRRHGGNPAKRTKPAERVTRSA